MEINNNFTNLSLCCADSFSKLTTGNIRMLAHDAQYQRMFGKKRPISHKSKLSKRLLFAIIWEPTISNRQKLLTPAIIGVLLGVCLIVLDIIFSQFNGIGRLQHPPFPSSLLASLSAGIGEEIMFRLFFISFWVWLISNMILRRKCESQVF